MSLLKEIGAILGFVAFGGLAVLAFLTFQQARHLRRLREWAGRAPELAAAESGRVSKRAAAATAPSIGGSERDLDKGPSRFERFRGQIAVRWEEAGRRSPVNPLVLLAGLVAVIVGVGIATSGFGLIGGGGSSTESTTATVDGGSSAPDVEVAVLNGTAPEEGGVGVVGIAKRVSKDVKSAGYKVGEVETAGSFATSVVMFEDGAKPEAKQLASDLEDLLGGTAIEAMTPEIQDLAGGAELALVIGLDDQGI